MATPSKGRVQLPAQLTAVEDLLLWHDVVKSGGVLFGATMLYLLLEWSGIPVITWFSNIMISAVLGTTLWAFVAHFAGSTGPAEHMPALLRTGLDDETVRTLADKTRVASNDGLALLGRIFSGNDFMLSFKTLTALWIVGWVGRIITPVGLLYTAILGLFTLPKLYEMRKDEIDNAVGQVRVAADKRYITAKAKANELIKSLTPQKGARPAASDISKDE